MTHEGQTGVVFESGGYRLLGTLFLARDAVPCPTAVILHGVPGIEKNVDLAHALREADWNSLIFHYRGCWGSAGDYTLRTIPADVRAALDFLGHCDLPVDASKLVLIGHSLGGWAALLAADDPRVKALAVYGAVIQPERLPFDAALAAVEFTPWLNGISAEEFGRQWAALGPEHRPLERVGRIPPRPLLIVHGEQDGVVPVAQARALAAAAPAADLRIHPGGNHAFAWHRPWLRDQILTWLSSLNL